MDRKQIEALTKQRCVEVVTERGHIWGWSHIQIEDTCAAIYSSIVDYPETTPADIPLARTEEELEDYFRNH